MQLFFESEGIYQHTSEEVRQHLRTRLSSEQVPCVRVIRKIMQERFNLKYCRLDKANIKYRDPQYNEKRMWVSRIMAQFILEEVVIISIDESNFRHDSLPLKQWQFNSKVLNQARTDKSRTRKRAKPVRNMSLLLRSDLEINYG